MKNSNEELQRYLDDKASTQEREELMRLFREGKLDDAILEDTMKSIFKEDSSEDMSPERMHEMRDYILSYQQQTRIVPITKNRNRIWTAAAAVLIIACSGAWLLMQQANTISHGNENKIFTSTALQNNCLIAHPMVKKYGK
jgi:hypothetical protein